MFAATDMHTQTNGFYVLNDPIECCGCDVVRGYDNHDGPRRRKCSANRAPPDPETTRGPCVLHGPRGCQDSLRANALPYTGAHAGRRKITIAAGEEVVHHTGMLEPHTHTVNTPSPLRIAFQGELGAFSEQVIHKVWGTNAVAVPAVTFHDAIARVTSGDTAYAVIPVENAIAGPVIPALAALEAAALHIRHFDETRIDVQLCLMAPNGATIESLREAYSHPMALAQSQHFFAAHPLLHAVVHDDTAGAARDVAHWNDVTKAAIAAVPAAARYGLTVLARAIQDSQENWTRFVIITRSC